MSRSPSDINVKNIRVLTCDLGWSNGYIFRQSSERPKIEFRRGCFLLSIFTSFFKLDRFFFSDVQKGNPV